MWADAYAASAASTAVSTMDPAVSTVLFQNQSRKSFPANPARKLSRVNTLGKARGYRKNSGQLLNALMNMK